LELRGQNRGATNTIISGHRYQLREKREKHVNDKNNVMHIYAWKGAHWIMGDSPAF